MPRRPYDKKKIGKFIGWGGEHLVFDYGENRVIKFSLHVWLAGKKAVEKLKRDYEIGQKYFGDYILPTEILTWKNNKKAVEIQDKISVRFLTAADLRNSLTKGQFDDIMERYKKMEAEIGSVFDLFGREGLFKIKPDFVSNILITPSGKLILNDFTVLKLNKFKMRELPIWFLIQWAKRRQKKLLKNFVK